MPSGLPLKREVSFLLIQADAASRRGLIQQLSCDVIFQAAITSPS